MSLNTKDQAMVDTASTGQPAFLASRVSQRTKTPCKAGEMRFVIINLFFTALLCLTSGCVPEEVKPTPQVETLPSPKLEPGEFPNDGLNTRYLIDQIDHYSRFMKDDRKIIITTFMDLNDLYKTTMLGRLIAEQVMSGLYMKGYRVTDVRQTKDIQLEKTVGELYLSRTPLPPVTMKKPVLPRGFVEDHIGDLVLVGTYQVGPISVFVNSRIINPKEEEIVSVASYQIPRTGLVDNLLSKSDEIIYPLPAPEPLPTIRIRQKGETGKAAVKKSSSRKSKARTTKAKGDSVEDIKKKRKAQ